MNNSDEVKNRIAEILATASVHDAFFVPVLRAIITSLKDTECILTEGNEWVKPTMALHRPQQLSQALVPNSVLRQCFDGELHFIDASMTGVAEKLQCETFGLLHMLTIITKIGVLELCSDAETRFMVARPKLLAGLNESRLADLYAFLHHTVGETEVQLLWDTKLFVLNTVEEAENATGTTISQLMVTSLADGPIFSSISSEWGYMKDMELVRVLGWSPDCPIVSPAPSKAYPVKVTHRRRTPIV